MRTILAVATSLLLTPLSAQFLPPEPSAVGRELHYSLSDRAYVAIFVILPGHGVALLYPFNPPSTQESAGDHYVTLQSAAIRRDERIQALMSEGDQADRALLFLVASRQPLRLAPYLTRQDALDSALGPAVQRSESMDAVTAGLVRLVANVSNADDIAYDLDQARDVIPRRARR